MKVSNYINSINNRYKSGITTEHSFRGDLQTLIEAIVPGILATNEPKRVKCGAPDYILTKQNIPVGYIEAKDIGANLNSKDYKEQFDRYKSSLSNLIITDYITFQLFRDGSLTKEIIIGEIFGNKIKPINENFESFERLIKDFCIQVGQTITSPLKLSKMMASKARLLADIINNSLTADTGDNTVSTLKDQFKAFKDVLIHDITEKGFADIYAQTIAYGMFAARLHDPSLDTFSRQEAAELIPKSNPFLRKLFQYIAGYDLDERIRWLVDDLADIFRATNVSKFLQNFGKMTKKDDPIIHFYETFLAEYDPKLRKSRGVWYTPEPVVNFIVRAVDDILKNEFDLKDGLADTSKVDVKFNTQSVDKRHSNGYKQVKSEVHKVQILDPAAGTGTFLAEVVKSIYKRFKGQEGIWSKYVEDDLIPRLNGFELLMASYSMAHLKLELLLSETGFKPTKDQRLRIYLTNSLEEYHPDTGTLFANWLSSEANEANYIKRDTPVMCVIGNPPYSVSSTNKNDWIQNLITDYKKNLNERKINLDDDYIKFIRYGQHYIDKNGSGVLAYISNNSFIDGITHRQMRKHLLESFDKVYILDLHGSAKKNETAPDGSKDENVFDIQQGVSINIFVKTGKKKKSALGQIFHYELYGRRNFKYQTLNENEFTTIKWNNLEKREPNNFFIQRDYQSEESYCLGIQINDLFLNHNSGIQTKNDSLTINYDKNELKVIVDEFKNSSVEDLKAKYKLKDTSGWSASKAKKDLMENPGNCYPIYYRPFDIRTIYMTEKSGGFVGRPRLSTMKYFFKGDNYGLITVRQQSTFDFQHILVSNTIMESGAISLQTKEWGYIFPLYIYPETSDQQTIEQTTERRPNLNSEIIKQISDRLGLIFTHEKETTDNTFAPVDLLDYIYAVLHSPTYREKYKEFLKIDFPRVPYPKDKDTFWQLVTVGGKLRQIHLLESPFVDNFITKYPIEGDNMVTKLKRQDDRIYINDQQYFDNVPENAWQFYIGGYQPAQKWLKDRKGRELSYDDIRHYQKIIVALTETNRIMKEIDKINFI